MKLHTIKYFLFSIILLSTGGCDFLEVDPIGRTTIPIFFSDMDGIRAAIPGMYSTVYDYYDSEFLKYPEVAGNMVSLNTVGGNTDMIKQYNFVSDPEDEIEAVGYIWKKTYVAMANINNVIEFQPELLAKYPQFEEELNRYKAEALFLRALNHFDLCRVYAQPYNYTTDASHLGIPILLKTPAANDNVARKSVGEVYAQIITDLEEAITLFEETTYQGVYFASQRAAYALLSRVYLYMEDWDDVITYSTKVMDEVPLSDAIDYLAMYGEMEPGDETIFRLNGTLKNSSLSKFYSISSPTAVPADTLIGLFDDPTDIRLKLLKQDDGVGAKACLKYHITKEVSEIEKHYDPIVFRVSEMYLNRAEAFVYKNKLSDATADVKAIIARGLDKSVEEIELGASSLAELLQIIDKERAKEFCFEGHQFYNIVRRKQNLVREVATTSSVQQIDYPSDLFVLPIPQKELEANTNMQPNPTVNK